MLKGRLFSILFLGFLVSATSAMADFQGQLELLPAGCESTGQCTLGADFGFIGADGYGWQASKGLITDGASIPPWAKKIVGQPFEKAFVRAAVIHDHYCNRKVRPWRQTHKVFYEGLLSAGVSKSKAGIMYFAVLVGGPKWVKLIKGKPCPVGMGCINSFQIGSSVSDGAFGVDESGVLLMTREQSFGSAQFENTLEEKTPELEALGDNLSAETVEKMANESMKGDFYFQNGDEVGTNLGLTVQ